MVDTIIKLQNIIDNGILNTTISLAGYRERSCMMYAKEITIRRINNRPIIRFIHTNGEQFADYDVNNGRWVG